MPTRVVVLALAACAAPPQALHGERVGASLADLAPVWRVDESVEAVVADRGWLAVLVGRPGGERAFQLIDQRDGYTTPRLVSDELAWANNTVIDATRIATFSLGSKQLVVVERPREHDERVVPRWSKPVGRDPIVSQIALDRERVYIALRPDYASRKVELRALRAGNGEVAWSHELADGTSVFHLASGPRAVAAGSIAISPQPSEAFAFGFDAATGATRWTYRGPAALATAVDDERVVFARGGSLVVVDRETGRDRAIRVPELADATRPDLALRDGVAYVASWMPDASAAIAFAVGLDDGRVRWRRRLPTPRGLLATAHALYVLTTGGVLHALDRDNGAPLWEWSIGIPRVRLVAGTLGDDRVFVIRNDAVVAFAVNGPPPPAEDAVIRTKLTRICPNEYHAVAVGDAEAVVHKNGDVEAHVHARGTVYVQAPDGDGREVEMIGHRDYRLPPLVSSPCDAP